MKARKCGLFLFSLVNKLQKKRVEMPLNPVVLIGNFAKDLLRTWVCSYLIPWKCFTKIGYNYFCSAKEFVFYAFSYQHFKQFSTPRT